MRSVPPSDTVVVDLTAGTAGPSVSHLPEVIFHASWEDASLLHPERNPQGQRGHSNEVKSVSKLNEAVGSFELARIMKLFTQSFSTVAKLFKTISSYIFAPLTCSSDSGISKTDPTKMGALKCLTNITVNTNH